MRIFASTPQALKQAFGSFGQADHVVSLVGGGGKSTLMYFMAEKCAGTGKRVLVSTTTHIFVPDGKYYAATVREAKTLWAAGKFAVIGTPVEGCGKLKAPKEPVLAELLREADVVFLEADGSKHCPIKVPRSGEPVLLPGSDVVLAVMGLSAIGRPLSECCFGAKGAMELLDTGEEHLLTEADAARILASPFGGRKDVGERAFCVVLNQCDDGPRYRSAMEIAARLREQGVEHVVMTAFDPGEREYYNAIAKGI